MTGTTSKGLPYPQGGDLLSQGDDTIKALADALNAMMPFRLALGSFSATALAGNASMTQTITLPVAAGFDAAPLAFCMAWSNGYNASSASPSSATVISCRATNVTATTQATLTLYWLAIQWAPGSGPGPAVLLAADTHTATCHTEGCDNAGHPIPMPLEETPEGDLPGVTCGVCGQPITDVQEGA